MNNLSWEYIAGFFDGEGTIHYMKRQYKKGTQNFVCLHITQCEKHEGKSHIIQRISEFLLSNGIQNSFARFGKKAKTWQPYYRVRASSLKACRDWLEGMLPFLQIKKQLALDTINFINTTSSTPNLSYNDYREIANMQNQNFSIKTIATKLQVDRNTISRSITRLGLIRIIYNIQRYKYGTK